MEFSVSMHPTSLPLQSPPSQRKESPSEHNFLSKSIMMANGMDDMDVTATSTDSALPLDLGWPTASLSGSSLHSIVVTPPPEGLPPPYPYPPWYAPPPPVTSSIPTAMHPSNLADYLYGSSIEYSPLSSPGSISNSNLNAAHEQQLMDDLTMAMSVSTKPPLCDVYYSEANSVIPTTGYQPMTTGYQPVMTTEYQPPVTTTGYQPVASSPTTQILHNDLGAPKEVKMPQRKGGIQLWQFLNYLLNNPEKKHRDLIEWTSNKSEREFRMIEPESIAIWWGHHKNKPGMTYDKFSRSLRYYYDKGILKKITGERYVYRFLIDPEVMYDHIGTSDCRPKIKPMPKAAKAAMTKFHKTHSMEFKAHETPRITLKEETLEKCSEATIHTSIQNTDVPSPEHWSVAQSSIHGNNSLQVSNLQSSLSTGNLTMPSDQATPLPIKRTKSLENARTDLQFNHPNYLLASSFPSNSNEYRGISAELEARAVPEFSNSFIPVGYDMFY